jgi:hypothetical protein
MKNKASFSILAGLALIACLALSAATTLAQRNNGIQRGSLTVNPDIIYLKCAPSSSDVAAVVTVTNNTTKPVPQGAKIFAKNQKGLSSTYTIGSGGLQPNAYVTFTLGGTYTDSSPCSAYAKK